MERALKILAAISFAVWCCGCMATSNEVHCQASLRCPEWGEPVRGIASSLRLTCNDDEMAAARTCFDSVTSIVVRLVVTNPGPSALCWSAEQRQVHNWRMALFDSCGIPVQETYEGLEQHKIRSMPPFTSGSCYVASPGRESIAFIDWLDKYFKIEHPGTYRLVMMRPMPSPEGGPDKLQSKPLSWDNGILISNLVEFHVKLATPAYCHSDQRGYVIRPSDSSPE